MSIPQNESQTDWSLQISGTLNKINLNEILPFSNLCLNYIISSVYVNTDLSFKHLFDTDENVVSQSNCFQMINKKNHESI